MIVSRVRSGYCFASAGRIRLGGLGAGWRGSCLSALVSVKRCACLVLVGGFVGVQRLLVRAVFSRRGPARCLLAVLAGGVGSELVTAGGDAGRGRQAGDRSRAVRPVSWGAVAGRSGASGVVRLGWDGCGPRWLALPCGRQTRWVRGPEFWLLGVAACGGRDCCRTVIQAYPGKYPPWDQAAAPPVEGQGCHAVCRARFPGCCRSGRSRCCHYLCVSACGVAGGLLCVGVC